LWQIHFWNQKILHFDYAAFNLPGSSSGLLHLLAQLPNAKNVLP